MLGRPNRDQTILVFELAADNYVVPRAVRRATLERCRTASIRGGCKMR